MSEQGTTVAASGKTSALTKVAMAWAAIAALVPTVIGVVMVRAPQRVMTPGTTGTRASTRKGAQSGKVPLVSGP